MSYEVEKENLDHISIVDMPPVDVNKIWGLDIAHGPVLTLLEIHDRDDENTACMYDL